LADALSAHARALRFGGVAGIPNLGLVQSAIGRPYTGYYRSLERKAAALVWSMSRNHGFADGNKRTTLILLHTMLTKSGYRLAAHHDDASIQTAAETMILDVVTGKLTFEQLSAWLKSRIRKRQSRHTR
jgi:death on curing protein